jgi:hypothetical protein
VLRAGGDGIRIGWGIISPDTGAANPGKAPMRMGR